MRGSERFDEPTLDPVDLERERIAQARAQTARERHARRLPVLTLLAVLVCLGLVTVYLILWATSVQSSGGPEGYVRQTPFATTLTGALVIREGRGPGLYDFDAQRLTQSRVLDPTGARTFNEIRPYAGLPFEAFGLAFFLGLPLWVVFGLWTLAAGFAMGIAVGLLDSTLPVSRPVGWALTLAACSYLPVIRSLMDGQDAPFVLVGLCGTYVAIKRNNEASAGVALLLVALRPQVLPVILLLLLLQRHFRAVAYFFLFLALLSVAAMPTLGASWPLDYLGFVSQLGSLGTILPDPAEMHNWRGFAAGLLGGTTLPSTVLVVVLSIVSLALLAWAWMRHPGDSGLDEDEGEARTDLLWALAAIVAVLVSFQLEATDLTLLVFPAWIIGAYATSHDYGVGLPRIWLLLLWLGYALPPISLFLSAGNEANQRALVIPSVLLMAVAAMLLTLRIAEPEPA